MTEKKQSSQVKSLSPVIFSIVGGIVLFFIYLPIDAFLFGDTLDTLTHYTGVFLPTLLLLLALSTEIFLTLKFLYKIIK